LVLIDEGDRLGLPSGRVLTGEDPFVDTALRVPLETAGFRRQHTEVLAADDAHVAIWCDGFRYAGDRPHAVADWWVGTAADGARRLRAQGDTAAARLVELAGAAVDGLSDEDFFAANTRLLETSYLDPRNDNPRQGSGFGGTAGEWIAGRSHLADAVERDGTFLDVGCANGLLLESLVVWCGERGHHVEPYGVDLSARLVEEAVRRLPAWADRFAVGNAIDWRPADGRRFDHVHTLLELVPAARRADLVSHLREHLVTPGGRVIISHYVPVDRRDQWPRTVLEALGFDVAGETVPDPTTARPVAPSAWIDA
jgi:2-polyprenyl-3-methyl-5-hydroxy-6-metoxy-1,4-benzoquinol methylase